MYIKYLIIKKFKSYRELSYIEPLSPHVNLIIGPNGHGKSNFLDAIIFALTDKYQNMRVEDKKKLLHEEPGEEITHISVELIIDNKSKRFPLDKDTVHITKIYHLEDNREEILINEKKLLKADVYNLLESAGFMKQNPYYIIQQGRINRIINMNEFELFELFSEVTGTKIYEEKREESLKLLEESKENRNKILIQANEISSYINRLNSQSKDLEKFDKLDVKRKAVEFVIHKEKLKHFQLKLDFLEERKADQTAILQSKYSASYKIKEKINENLYQITQKTKIIEQLQNKIKKCEKEISQIKQISNLDEINLSMMNEKAQNKENELSSCEIELMKIKEDKQKIENDLQTTKQKINDLEKFIENTQQEYNKLIERNTLLMLKENKDNAFSDVEAKKKYLNNQIEALTKKKEEINKRIIEMNDSIHKDETLFEEMEQELKRNDTSNVDFSKEIQEINEKILLNKKERMENANQIKKIDFEINEINNDLEFLNESCRNLIKKLPNYEIVQAVNRIRSMNFSGFLGIVLDIFDVDPNLKAGVDLIGKDRLYSIIVDSAASANKILEFNNANNGPVISIYPMDWNKKSKSISYPSNNEAVPFIKYIKVKDSFIRELNEIGFYYTVDSFKPIIQKIFGKALLVKTYEAGVKYAKDYKMNCVTPDNEIIYSGGYVTKVGFYDINKERSKIYFDLNENNQKIENLKKTKESLENKRKVFSNNDTKYLRDLQSILLRKNEIQNKFTNIANNNKIFAENILNLKTTLNEKKQIFEQLLQEKENMDNSVQSLYDIINSDSLGTKLTLEDQQQIENVKRNKQILEKKLIELEKAKSTLLANKNKIEFNLNEQLTKRENQLKSKIEEISIYRKNDIFDFSNEKQIINELENNSKNIEMFNTERIRIKEEINLIQDQISQLNKIINDLKDENNKITEIVNKEEAKMKKILLNLKEINEKKEETLKYTTKLGQIDQKEFEKLLTEKENQEKLFENFAGDENLKMENILKPFYEKLEAFNNKIKRFNKINRFALDDLKLFKEKKDEVSAKLDELDKREEEIMEVIGLLDQKKDHAIEDTFAKVNDFFGSFFQAIVPSGSAQLKLYNLKTSQLVVRPTQSNGLSRAIYMNVSFNNKTAPQDMHQLSGGQRTAVALALIFSLSKIDPPPFYILDEVDAALDPSYRVNLSNLIHTMSQDNQFIITSFKSELIDVADNIYEVKFANKNSTVNLITKEEAKKMTLS